MKTGITSGQQVQIVSGLEPGEMVVTEGAYGLPDKTKIKIEKPEKDQLLVKTPKTKKKKKKKTKEKNKGDDEKSKPDAGSKKAAQPRANGKEMAAAQRINSTWRMNPRSRTIPI